MKKVSDNIPEYTLNIIAYNFGQNTIKIKSYNKGQKWKNISIIEGAQEGTSIELSDGSNIYDYWEGENIVTQRNLDFYSHYIRVNKKGLKCLNTLDFLVDWAKANTIIHPDLNKKPKGKFINSNANKNGFDCRLIQFDDQTEVCINDQYGIAVYIKTLNNLEYNVTDISTENISDSVFELPRGMAKRMDY